MNVSLTPELEKLVAEKVKSGMYNSASEVVRAGLRLLQKEDEEHQRKLERLKGDIQLSVNEFERGEFKTATSPREFLRGIADRVESRQPETSGLESKTGS